MGRELLSNGESPVVTGEDILSSARQNFSGCRVTHRTRHRRDTGHTSFVFKETPVSSKGQGVKVLWRIKDMSGKGILNLFNPSGSENALTGCFGGGHVCDFSQLLTVRKVHHMQAASALLTEHPVGSVGKPRKGEKMTSHVGTQSAVYFRWQYAE